MAPEPLPLVVCLVAECVLWEKDREQEGGA